NDDAQRQARSTQKPAAPKPATESRVLDAKPAPARSEPATASQQEALRPAAVKPAPAPSADVEIAKPIENAVTGSEAPATPADAAGTGKRRRGRRGGRRRKHANAQDGAAPATPHDIDDEDADRNGAPQATRPPNARNESPHATDSAAAQRAPAPAPSATPAAPVAATPAPVVHEHEHAPITPLFAVPEQKPTAPVLAAPAPLQPSIAASASSDNVPRPTTPPVHASTSVTPTSVTPASAASQASSVSSATPSPLPPAVTVTLPVQPVAP